MTGPTETALKSRAIKQVFTMHCTTILISVLSALSVAGAYLIEPVTAPVIMGESPFWDDDTDTVIFVDIVGKKVLRYDPAHPEDLKFIRFTGGRVSPAVPVANASQLLVGVRRSLVLADVDWGSAGTAARLKSTKVLATVDADLPGNRFNDGKADSKGRLFIGTMDDSRTARRRRDTSPTSGRGSVYRFDLFEDESGAVSVETERVISDHEIPNGMAWTSERGDGSQVYYLADSAGAVVNAHEVVGGRLTGRVEVAFNFTANDVPGVPDGMALDVDGNLWVACVHGGRVIRVDPRTGALLRVVPVGVTGVSAVVWGGPRRDVLYATTSRYGRSERDLAAEPHAGSLLAISGLGTRGRAGEPCAARLRLRPVPPSRGKFPTTGEMFTSKTEKFPRMGNV